MKLSDAQERALTALRDHADRYGPMSFTKPQGVSETTLYVLRQHGLVAIEERNVTVARITEAGSLLLQANNQKEK